MEASESLDSLESLTNSMNQTIKNLQEKHDFLAQQRDHYSSIRHRLLSYSDDDNEGNNDNGLVLGDIIISSKKIYLNLGYEFFVEKSLENTIEYIDDKLGLIVEAMEQFASKIKDAKSTLKDFKTLSGPPQIQSELDDQLEAEFDDSLPSMEIREELDEQGNVINSSVTPTSTQFMRKTKADKGESTSNDFENNLKGKLISKEESNSNHPVGEGFGQIDMENVYTFADLVRQMDEQDEQDDDNSTDAANVEYDFDSYDKKLNYDKEEEEEEAEEEEEEEEEYDDDRQYSVLPNLEAHSAFMDQIRQLRANKTSTQSTQSTKQKVQRGEPKKSILKKKELATNERPKKSVGFASSLDIHEVENLKEDNQKNTHRFPHALMQPLDYDEDNRGLSSDEFDSELFAQLIGVQGPDEIHNKYKEELAPETDVPPDTKRKKRVSRFKQQREGRKHGDSPIVSAMTSAIIEKEDGDLSANPENESVVSDTVMERDNTDENINRQEASESRVSGDISKSAQVPRVEGFTLPSKKLNSLQRPRKPATDQELSKITSELMPSSGDDSDSSQGSKEEHESTDSFPTEILDKANQETKPLRKANVDFNSLGSNMDDMVQAYALGVYDDDLDDDPGMLLEKVDDFKDYNKQVELLKDDINEFRISNPMEEQVPSTDPEDDGPLMTNITENEIPENCGAADEQEDLALDPGRLSESIAIEYSRLREVINARASTHADSPEAGEDNENKQLEPIDEYGVPIKTSRFRSQRLKMKK